MYSFTFSRCFLAMVSTNYNHQAKLKYSSILTFQKQCQASPTVRANHRSEKHFLKAEWLLCNNSKMVFENSPPLDLLKRGHLTR